MGIYCDNIASVIYYLTGLFRQPLTTLIDTELFPLVRSVDHARTLRKLTFSVAAAESADLHTKITRPGNMCLETRYVVNWGESNGDKYRTYAILKWWQVSIDYNGIHTVVSFVLNRNEKCKHCRNFHYHRYHCPK